MVAFELDLLGTFSQVPDPPNTEQARDECADDLHDFPDRSLPSKSTSSRTNVADLRPIQSDSLASEHLALSNSPPTLSSTSIIAEQQIKHDSSFRLGVSWGSKNSRYRKRQKPPIHPIRACKRLKPTIRDEEELLLEEEIAASALLMLANQKPWKVTKFLTQSDLDHNQGRLLLGKALVHQHIIPYLDEQSNEKIHSKDGLIVNVRDCDTDDNKVFQLKLKWWGSSKNYNFQGRWINDFVNRRSLKSGDEIGLFWSEIDNLFVFSVLKRAN